MFRLSIFFQPSASMCRAAFDPVGVIPSHMKTYILFSVFLYADRWFVDIKRALWTPAIRARTYFLLYSDAYNMFLRTAVVYTSQAANWLTWKCLVFSNKPVSFWGGRGGRYAVMEVYFASFYNNNSSLIMSDVVLSTLSVLPPHHNVKRSLLRSISSCPKIVTL